MGCYSYPDIFMAAKHDFLFVQKHEFYSMFTVPRIWSSLRFYDIKKNDSCFLWFQVLFSLRFHVAKIKPNFLSVFMVPKTLSLSLYGIKIFFLLFSQTWFSFGLSSIKIGDAIHPKERMFLLFLWHRNLPSILRHQNLPSPSVLQNIILPQFWWD